MLRPPGAAGNLAAGVTWIDMTSNSPAAAQPIREQVIGQRADVLEAPAGGGYKPRRAATVCRGASHAWPEGSVHCWKPSAAPDRARRRPRCQVAGQPAEALLPGQRTGIDLQLPQQAFSGSQVASTLISRDMDA